MKIVNKYLYVLLLFIQSIDISYAKYCLLGVCKGINANSLFTEKEIEIYSRYNQNFRTGVATKFDKNWTELATELEIYPGNSVFGIHFSKTLSVCANFFHYFLPEDKDPTIILRKISERIENDTGHKGDVFIPKNMSPSNSQHFIWKDFKVRKLKDVKKYNFT